MTSRSPGRRGPARITFLGLQHPSIMYAGAVAVPLLVSPITSAVIVVFVLNPPCDRCRTGSPDAADRSGYPLSGGSSITCRGDDFGSGTSYRDL